MNADFPTVEYIDGQLVLRDPVAYAVMCAVGKHNCKITMEAQKDRVEHFAQRIKVRGDSTKSVAILLANVDTPIGELFADLTMPGYDWVAIRESGQIPFARGLVLRPSFQEILDKLDADVGKKMKEMDGLVIIVADHGVVEVFEYNQ